MTILNERSTSYGIRFLGRICICLLGLTIICQQAVTAETPQQMEERRRADQERREAAEQQRQAAEQRAEEQRQAAEQRAEQQREAAEQREQQREAAEQRAEQQRQAAEQRAEQQRQAEDQRAAQQQRQTPAPAATSNVTPNNNNSSAPSRPTYDSRPSVAIPATSRPNLPVTTYTPRSSSASPTASSTTGTRPTGTITYTPHSGSAPVQGSGDGRVRTSNGVTTYTPQRLSTLPSATAPTTPTIASRTVNVPRTVRIVIPKTIDQINVARSTMHGINHKVLPKGVVVNHPNGEITIKTANGDEYTVRSNGTLRTVSRGNQTVNFRSNGHLVAIHRPEIDIHRGPRGGRIIISRRADRSVLVSTAPYRGYLERTVNVGNRTFIQRTYVEGVVSRRYLRYTYAGLTLPLYVPAVYYPTSFYGWAYYAWSSPVRYDWPSTAYDYSNYYAPYGTYPSGFAWLADLIMKKTFANAHADQNQDLLGESSDDTADVADDETLDAQTDTAVTEQVRDEIAVEVQQQIAYESAMASGKVDPSAGEFPASLKPNRIFLVSNILDVSTPDQYVCSLTPGDVLRLDAAIAGSGTANLQVASSRRGDCPAGMVATISLVDLQEMQNSLRAELDNGLATLHAIQGLAGLPAAPASSMGAAQPSFVEPISDDPNVATLVREQQQQAAHIEAMAVEAALPPIPPPPPPGN
jgi:hypothetical protein